VRSSHSNKKDELVLQQTED